MSRTLPLLLVATIGCAFTAPLPAPSGQILRQGFKTGTVALLKQQSDDGAWRSDVYATFRDGTALTPLVLCTLQDLDGFTDTRSARSHAGEWLAKWSKPDGTIDEGKDGLPYPAYTAALSVVALSHRENKDRVAARDAWLKYLLARQLTEQNGWTPGDKQYGGWGYYPLVPKKPAPGEAVPAQHLLESNLSATTFALDALKAAGVTDPKVLGPARRFVESCQNDDGGFHFIYDDPVRNKAGATGSDGKPRFHSYGSATADGVRALLHCGATPDDPKVVAGRGWLVKHFTPDRHPGEYVPTHESNRDAVYFYYAASVAKTFRRLGVKEVNGRPWEGPLAEALMARQRSDGSWENQVDLVRENDPVVATAYALTALAECRKASQ
jgi:hypothetical protein